MAIIKCAECGRDVSTTAKSCPGCGAKIRKPTSALTKIVGGLLVVGFIGAALSPKSEHASAPAAAPAQNTPEQLAAEAKREAAFQRTVAVTRTIRSALREPDSVKWESIRANDDASLVCIEYRARNGFGGMNREIAVIQGASVSQRPADWNKHCTKALNDMAHVEYAL